MNRRLTTYIVYFMAVASRSTRCTRCRASAASHFERRSTSMSSAPPKKRSERLERRPRSWRSNPRAATSWRWRTDRSTTPSTGALEGRYPPGSTFKIVTTTALLRGDEVEAQTEIDCPQTATVDGRQFKNFESSALGPVPFREIFAESCNTGFVSLSDELGPDDLSLAARSFGIGERLSLPVPAYGGDVPRMRDPVASAAASIGQDRILVSPLALAAMAATVADGRWRAPRLLETDRSRAGEPLGRNELGNLREFTRLVVTSGTGTALASAPGELRGKSGTAEFGAGDPPPTHAWFVAFRDDVASSGLVEGGQSGSEVAAPIAADFFEALGGG